MGKTLKLVLLPAALALALVIAAGCGGDDDGGASGDTIVHGTTDQPVSYDPSGSYDLPSWNIIYNVMEGLMTVPPGGNTAEPALAESCDTTDSKVYTCTLKEDVKFHDGSDFTAEDVKASFDRNWRISDENGASSLLAPLYAEEKKVEGTEVQVVDDFTVRFNLLKPDATWPFILTTGAGAITPSEYPADSLQPDASAVGTGPYKLAEFRPGEQTVLEANEDYHGDEPKNGRTIVQYFDKSSALKLAAENGEVDIAYRSLTPTEVADLRSADSIEVVEGNGTEIRYLVFNLKFDPGKQLPVRRAVAQTIDRQAIVDNVYNGTVEPLYSMVPRGLPGHVPAFSQMYGEAPDVNAARQALTAAGVSTPVNLEVWWTPSHYGDSSADEYAEIKRSLEASNLFKVTLKSTEWDQYSEAATTDQYPTFQLGWFPDFPDADNYLAPFYSSDNFLNNHYSSKRVDALLAAEKASADQAERTGSFEQIQQIAAREVPIVPIWQGRQVAAVREGVAGVEETFDPSFQFRYWLISK